MSELYCCGYLVVMIITATRHCMVILQYNIVLPKAGKNNRLHGTYSHYWLDMQYNKGEVLQLIIYTLILAITSSQSLQ